MSFEQPNNYRAKLTFLQKLICKSNQNVTFCICNLKFFTNYWERNFPAQKRTAVLSGKHQWIARKYLTVGVYFSFPLAERCVLLTYMTKIFIPKFETVHFFEFSYLQHQPL